MREPHQGETCLVEESPHEETEEHPISSWTSLKPGEVVSFRLLGSQDYVGTVELKTSDGLIIWVRDDLNERKAFHFKECQSVRLVR